MGYGKVGPILTTDQGTETTRGSGRPWNVLLPLAFSIFSGYILFISIIAPLSIGSHAVIYADAAAAWLAGENPWAVGPPDAVFAGPPSMLVPFAPFAALPPEITRLAWVMIAAAAAFGSIRAMSLPMYWLGFPPMFQAIMLGHPEVVVLWLVLVGRVFGGLAAAIKPYAVVPLLAERRWTAIGMGMVAILATAPLLPWGTFLEQLPLIAANLNRQANGDSAFGNVVLTVLSAVVLLSFGVRRALWLATPLLWPNAQFMYRTISTPALSPIIAIAWAFPIPGALLVGLVVDRAVALIAARRQIPSWLARGTEPIMIGV